MKLCSTSLHNFSHAISMLCQPTHHSRFMCSKSYEKLFSDSPMTGAIMMPISKAYLCYYSKGWHSHRKSSTQPPRNVKWNNTTCVLSTLYPILNINGSIWVSSTRQQNIISNVMTMTYLAIKF